MSKTVLTIDDSRTMREMLNHALVQAGYTVIQAVDGVEGLEVLQAQGADVVITDNSIPPPSTSKWLVTPFPLCP